MRMAQDSLSPFPIVPLLLCYLRVPSISKTPVLSSKYLSHPLFERQRKQTPLQIVRRVGTLSHVLVMSFVEKGYDSDEIRRHASRVHANQNAEVEYRPKVELEAAVKEMMDTCKIIGFHNPTGEGCSSALLKGDDESIESLRKSILGSSQLGLGPFDPDSGNQSLFSGYLCAALARISSERLKCNLCGESISNKPDAVVYHLRGHISFSKFVCPYCGIYIESALCYEMHLNSEHADMDNQRPIDYVRKILCKELSEMVEVLFDGINQALTLKCELCGQMILWRWSSLLMHARQHENYYPYQCGICDTMFPDQMLFTQHLLQANHPVKQTTMQVISNYEAEEQSFRNLSKCFPLFTSQLLDNFAASRNDDTLTKASASSAVSPADDAQGNSSYKSPKLHIQTSGKATLHCKLCQAKISRNMSCLIAHAKVHLAYKPLKCEYCNFRHFAMSKIRRHNVRVHGSKPVKVSYHPVADIGRQIKEMKLECFGSCLSSRNLYQRSAASTAGNEEDAVVDDECPSAAENVDTALTGQLPFLLPFSMDAGKALQMAAMAGNGSDARCSTATGSSTSAAAGSILNRLSAATVSLDEVLKQEGCSSTADHCDLPGLGKKMCCMCNTYIANNPSSFENHACKHLDYKPYHCQYCTYQSYIRGKV
ncbi:unnamed protein product, partial [Soboliphyme baturini]|uniref:C2H2-type domain-containing protein n=1 Tax=Soboliphyme baturini TaxID=241478 RepID=A0A183IVP5_9BILA